MHSWCRSVVMYAICVSSFAWADSLPGQAEIAGIDKAAVRSGYQRVLLHDYNSWEVFHPYFVESINAIMAKYGDSTAVLPVAASGEDSTCGFYLDVLERAGGAVLVMSELQGRVMRVLINAGIPILMLGSDHHARYGVYRVFGDVLYAYRDPEFSQSNRIDGRDRAYEFRSIRGFGLETKDGFAPPSREVSKWDPQIAKLSAATVKADIDTRQDHQLEQLWYQRRESPLKWPPYHMFQHFCIVVLPGQTLDEVKKKINDGLSDVGFEYKLPEFRKLTASMLE